EQVDDLDPCLQDLVGRAYLVNGRRPAVDGVPLRCLHGPLAVNGLTQHVEEPARNLAPHRYGDGRSGVQNALAALQAVGGRHGHAADGVVPQVLLRLQHQGGPAVGAVARLAGGQDVQRVVEFGKLPRIELDV